MVNKFKDALEYISDKHIAEAAAAKKRRNYWPGAVAAVLAVLIGVNSFLALSAPVKAVSIADYPKYQWTYLGPEMEAARENLRSFFTTSISRSLSGSNGKNQTYSPLNLYMALALTAELSSGESQAQILSLTNADSLEALRAQAKQVWRASYYDDGDQALLANSLWLNKELRYNDTVMETLANNYYTSVYQSELGSDDTNQAIQNWLNNQTKGLLEKEIENAGIQADPTTFPVFALYSTVYYQAMWASAFHPGNNADGLFHSPKGDFETTFMNKKEMETLYYWGEDFGAVALGTKDGGQMWLILPDEGKTVEDVIHSEEYMDLVLAPYGQNATEECSKYLKVNLSIPKFDITASGDLKEHIMQLGVTDIFDADTADFSHSVTGDYPVWISAVNQATRVAIDEEGITAASYIEAVAPGAAPPPEEIIDFILDRPFIFIITNRYHLPLFAGVVNEP